ncbi:MAG: uncharacterized protein KVP18_002011 [Porospora cf. gigantea A]|uniref:uncharacterized protein n=1 Tax=Porospora cf. gigantea A TaxID=2853593 RepID=UPI0035593BB0|nr:MAG: hypothetical protein KVP18_002011 [Porospora cf. gigantea A]
MSVMEMSHRSKTYDQIHNQCIQDLRNLLQVPSTYDVLLMQGGGTAQFAAVPLNLVSGPQMKAGYVVTGTWSGKAATEAAKFAEVVEVYSDKKCKSLPTSVQGPEDLSYLYYCANETISGLEFSDAPVYSSNVDVVADMSSNFCTRPVNVGKHGVIFAGVQKNVGPAGLGVVIARHDLVEKSKRKAVPAVLDWKAFKDTDSLYHTPPCWSIYVTGLVLQYLKKTGGLSYWSERSALKSQMLYDIIDSSHGFYKCSVAKGSRSRCNVSFTCESPQLDTMFVQQAISAKRFENLKGHRSVGGVRASVYNGMPMEGVEALAEFMMEFMQMHDNENRD